MKIDSFELIFYADIIEVVLSCDVLQNKLYLITSLDFVLCIDGNAYDYYDCLLKMMRSVSIL
jgi:hypothetical protein